jgi:formylglycine-generating enzyme required for sulfatase activity
MPGHVGTHRRQPAVRISRNEAEAFCRWLSKKCSVKASLPTEEEWEWAARAGTATPFPWGGLDDDFSKYANLADKTTRWMYSAWDGAASIQTRRPYKEDMNYPLRDDRFEDDWFSINFTARARTNWWGLYDMHGNAAEWTSSTKGGKAIVRGGAYDSRPKDATSSYKQYYLPWQKVYNVGFRVLIEE